MPRFIFVLALVLCSRLAAQENIRQVDFKNFSYPLSGHLLGHDSLEWLDTPAHPATTRRTIHLVDGSELTKTSSIVVDGKEYGQYEGFTFESVSYADLTGDGNDEAIIILTYHTGGTQTTNYVYVYTLEEHRPSSSLTATRETDQIQDSTMRPQEMACSSLNYLIQRKHPGSAVLPVF